MIPARIDCRGHARRVREPVWQKLRYRLPDEATTILYEYAIRIRRKYALRIITVYDLRGRIEALRLIGIANTWGSVRGVLQNPLRI